MEVKKEPDQCRLCFTQITKYVHIFKESTPIHNIMETLKQYFHDEVNGKSIANTIFSSFIQFSHKHV